MTEQMRQGAGVADRTDAGRMVLAYRLSTRHMTRNVYRDKEQESNVQTISEAMHLMEVPVSVGWLAPKKLEATDRLGIEKEISKYASDIGRAKLTEEKAKDWCNVCQVFMEASGRLSSTMQRGALVNTFRVMIDHGGDIKAGIRSYSSLVNAEKERLSAVVYTKMLTV